MNGSRALLVLVIVTSASACDGLLAQSRLVALVHDEAGTGSAFVDAGHVVPPAVCTGRCCPSACPMPTRDGATYSGPECFAQRDNTGARRWQLRQTQNISEGPPGVHASQIANFLAARSSLKSAACGTPTGSGGFIQLIDFDREAGTSRVGFSRYVLDESAGLADGLCFVEDTYDDAKWRLDRLYEPQGWPVGLPRPMTLPWKVAPVLTKRIDDDFVLRDARETLLSELAPGGKYAGFGGVFHLDERHGFLHGYAPLVFIMNYDSPTSYNAIPIREVELTMQTNDPEHPNCAGVFLGDSPSLPKNCEGNATNPAWGCAPGDCPPTQLGPAVVKGYFLVAEAEQIHNVIGQTLCALFPGGPVPNWTMKEACREDPKFDATDPVNGFPPGDFCARTNDVATPDCHDAWRSVSYATFQAFPIQDGTCPAK